MNNPQSPTTNFQMSAQERRAVGLLSSIFAVRMLGLFMVLPIFTLFAQQLTGATPFLIGIALGIYGLTQACMQIPFGFTSDHIGRKKVIATGLIILIIGSIVTAMSQSILGVIIGRALQGAGAIGSTLMALLADLTRPEQRTKAMAALGIVIGSSFAFALIIGSIVTSWFGPRSVFWLTALLACIGVIILYRYVANPPKATDAHSRQILWSQVRHVFTHFGLAKLNLSILLLHALLTATFMAVPIMLRDFAGVYSQHHWYFYLTVLFIAFLIALPLLFIAEKKSITEPLLLCSILLLFLSQCALWMVQPDFLSLTVIMIIFFTGFALLEALLPAMVSRLAPIQYKGTALGIYSTAQFLGIFLGGSLGGWFFSAYGLNQLFLLHAILCLLWFLFMLSYRHK